jgi:hypothetical protein
MQWLLQYYYEVENLEPLRHHVIAMLLVSLMRLKVPIPEVLVSKIAMECIDEVLTR